MDNSEVFHKAEQIRDVIRYLRLFKGSTAVVHIDDTIIDSPYFASHIRDLCLIQEAGLKIIIVPGARKRINEILNQANISWQMENSCRITDEKAMPLIKMAAFDVSNRVMTSFAAEKRTAVIGNWVRARGKGINLGVDYGTAGEIDKIQVEAVNSVLDNGFIPIFPCIGWSISGKPYNISSSQLATALAVKMKADKLFFLTQNTTINAENFVIPPNSTFIKEKSIPAMNLQEVSSFISLNESASQTFENDKKDFVLQTLSLLRMALSACRTGVSRVHILNGSFNGTLPCEIFSDFGSGTMIYEDNYGGIRGMELDDIPDILNLIRPFVEEKILLPRTENDLIEQYKDYTVYELDSGIRACAALHFYDDGQAEIAAVAVDNNFTHLGVGPKIVNYLIDKARTMNAKRVFVLTTRTADWFEQFGFVPCTIDSLPEKRRAKWTPERGSKALSFYL
ncbi:MAG: amino-acid N-acetyltransferase [Treponemataceae bacterium]|nr:amino-acid N-acetyltransferase [Treponemataceae bacterium]